MMAAKDVLDTVVRLAVSETLEVRCPSQTKCTSTARVSHASSHQVDDEVRDKARRLLQAWAHATRLGAFQEALAELATVDGIPGHGAQSSRDPRVYGLDPAMVRLWRHDSRAKKQPAREPDTPLFPVSEATGCGCSWRLAERHQRAQASE